MLIFDYNIYENNYKKWFYYRKIDKKHDSTKIGNLLLASPSIYWSGLRSVPKANRII
jgi:hypothetical protein